MEHITVEKDEGTTVNRLIPKLGKNQDITTEMTDQMTKIRNLTALKGMIGIIFTRRNRNKSILRDKQKRKHVNNCILSPYTFTDMSDETMVENAINHDLDHVVTPVKLDILEQMLVQTGYDQQETDYLVNGFKEGFDLEYQGPRDRRDESDNIPFTIGDEFEMWSKIMKEVKEGRYAGPFEEIPFEYYIQSPIGLVPKDGGRKT